MTLPTIFDCVRPRADVLKGAITEADFAADLAQVIRGNAPDEYKLPDRFFANTYPTRGLRNLLLNVCARLGGTSAAASIFRLDTAYGGGKTHGLIALVHAARGMQGVANVSEFINPARLPKGSVRIAAFDGENADPANGRAMDCGVRAFTPWGEIACSLAGREGYERVRRSDEQMIAPGAETIRELFGGKPSLILLDELSVYLRKVSKIAAAREQLTAFLTSLFKAIESTSNAALVYTLAIGKEGRATDAYSDENQFIYAKMAEAESVSARKATLLNPTEEDETVQVLRRRLFEQIDERRGREIIEAYRAAWATNQDTLDPEATRPETVESFRASYPFHPEVLATLTGKTATLGNFQRVRGLLRLLARTVARVWETRPIDATAIHLHHMDPGFEPIRQEIVTRLGQGAYQPAISSDIAAKEAGKKALAQQIDADHYVGSVPYASYVARTIFLHSLAFNEPLKGLLPERLRYSVLGPTTDVGFIEDARKRFMEESAYLDDRPGAPLRFLAEANLTQIIRRQEQYVEPDDARRQLNDRITQIFAGKTFDMVPFPAGPYEVPDEVGDGRPKLALISYDAVSVGGTVDEVPELIGRIFERKGVDAAGYRALRNHLAFVVADEGRRDDMRRKMVRRLALLELKKPERLAELAEHQQAKVKEWEARSEQELAITIQQAYRHVFYPSRNRVAGGDVDLAHSAIDLPASSDKPGAGQAQVVRALRDAGKLRTSEDPPDSPSYIRDRTPLKKGQITTRALRDEFRRDPGLAILIGDDTFIRGIRQGVEKGEFVYRRGDLLFGPGDPLVAIQIDEESIVFTMAYATEKNIWPRQKPRDVTTGDGADVSGDGGTTVGGGMPPGIGSGPVPGAGSGTATAPLPGTLMAEGVLREALTKLWEQVRSRKIARVGLLTTRLFEASDAFRLLAAVGAVPGASKVVTFVGGYETKQGSTLQLEFRGTIEDAKPLKEFLEAQLRGAESPKLEVGFELTFTDGLDVAGNAPEQLAERLSKFASGAAYVTATAEAKA